LHVVRKPFFRFPALRLRPVCVCCRHFFGSAIQSVNPSYVFSGNQVAISVNCDLNATVPHLLLNVGRRNSGLNQQGSERVAQIMKAEFPKPSLLRTEVSDARIDRT
jgi:hypothetical protein